MRAIEGLSLVVRPGEVLGLVGESGCGKSVTALSIMRLIPPRSGRIVRGHVRFERHDLAELDEARMRESHGPSVGAANTVHANATRPRVGEWRPKRGVPSHQ